MGQDERKSIGKLEMITFESTASLFPPDTYTPTGTLTFEYDGNHSGVRGSRFVWLYCNKD